MGREGHLAHAWGWHLGSGQGQPFTTALITKPGLALVAATLSGSLGPGPAGAQRIRIRAEGRQAAGSKNTGLSPGP